MIGRTNAGGNVVRALTCKITSPPKQVEYSVDDRLNLTGLVVTATFSDGTSRDVTSECTCTPATGTVLNLSHQSVTIKWKKFTMTQPISVTDVHIYGVNWAGNSSPKMTRTDDAAMFVDPVPYVEGASAYSSPFDKCMPWKGMRRVTDVKAGELVEIPKFYYKWTRSGSSMKLQIADKKTAGFLISPAHADRGDGKGERDLVYVGRYHCATGYKSKTGESPANYGTRDSFRRNIAALDSTVWQWDFAMYWTIAMLYIVEFATWNSQDAIGYGCSDGGDIQNNGLTDSMPYHTGTTKSSRQSYGHTQYRYIEDLWSNVYDWCDGIYFSGSNVYCIKNPSKFSDNSGGTMVGSRYTSDDWIKGFTDPTATGFEYALYPNAGGGSDSTYICDYCSYGGAVLFVGGHYYQDRSRGLFYLNGNYSASDSSSSVGSRLQKLP